MTQSNIQLYHTLKNIMCDMVPEIIREAIQVQSKIDALPDFPSYAEVGRAIGISAAQVARYVRDHGVEVIHLRHSTTRRIHKADIIDMIIHKRYKTIK